MSCARVCRRRPTRTSRRFAPRTRLSTSHQANRLTESPPSRRRGSKHIINTNIIILNLVASFAEAWIETMSSDRVSLSNLTSPPSRRRGSKPFTPANGDDVTLSPPSRRRGSKRAQTANFPKSRQGRLLRGGVDRNFRHVNLPPTRRASPPSRRRGSKRSNTRLTRLSRLVASFAEAWIETVR